MIVMCSEYRPGRIYTLGSTWFDVVRLSASPPLLTHIYHPVISALHVSHCFHVGLFRERKVNTAEYSYLHFLVLLSCRCTLGGALILLIFQLFQFDVICCTIVPQKFWLIKTMKTSWERSNFTDHILNPTYGERRPFYTSIPTPLPDLEAKWSESVSRVMFSVTLFTSFSVCVTWGIPLSRSADCYGSWRITQLT